MTITQLQPILTNQKSYYNKAKIENIGKQKKPTILWHFNSQCIR